MRGPDRMIAAISGRRLNPPYRDFRGATKRELTLKIFPMLAVWNLIGQNVSPTS